MADDEQKYDGATPYERWELMQVSSPTSAAMYYTRNRNAIEASRPATPTPSSPRSSGPTQAEPSPAHQAMEAVTEAVAAMERGVPQDKRALLELAPDASDPTARLKWLTAARTKGLFDPAPRPAAPASSSGFFEEKKRWLMKLDQEEAARKEAAARESPPWRQEEARKQAEENLRQERIARGDGPVPILKRKGHGY